jgi:hypothetical protein
LQFAERNLASPNHEAALAAQIEHDWVHNRLAFQNYS